MKRKKHWSWRAGVLVLVIGVLAFNISVRAATWIQSALSPRSVAAGDISTYYSGTDDWYKSLVWFGNENDWQSPEGNRLIGTDKVLFRTIYADTNELLMLSETTMDSCGEASGAGGKYNAYQGSHQQDTLTSLYTTKFQSQISGWVKSVNIGNVTNNDGIATNGTKDVMYLLSKTEAENPLYFSQGGVSKVGVRVNSTLDYYRGKVSWKLRSPVYASGDRQYFVALEGQIGDNYANLTYYLRAAFRLKPEAVMFVSAAVKGGSPAVSNTLGKDGPVKGAFKSTNSATANYDSFGTYRDTNLSDNQTLRPFTRGGQSLGGVTASKISDKAIRLEYNGASAGADSYLGAMLVNTATGQKYVGRVAQIDTASGSVELTLPEGAVDNSAYKLFVWVENESSQNTSATPDAMSLTNLPDGIPPDITDAAQSNADWAGEKTISATVKDNENKVNRVFYATESGATSGTPMSAAGDVYTSPPIDKAGTYYIIAYDEMGNRSAQSVTVDKIDDIPPVVTGGAQSNADWASEKTISATAADNESGIDRVFYTREDGATSGTAMSASGDTYTSPAITADGTYYIVAYDKANNRGQSAVVVDHVDTSPPTIEEAALQPEHWAAEKTITARIEDAGSGIANVTYSGPQSGSMTRQNARSGDSLWETGVLTQAGTYTLSATDVLGNTHSITIEATKMGEDPNAYVPQYPGDSGHTTVITVEVSDRPPLNLSVTVPLTLPVAMKLTGGAEDAAELYWPDDGKYYIMNNSRNYTDAARTQAYPVTVRVKEVRVKQAQTGGMWSLVPEDSLLAPTEDNAFQMSLAIGGTQIPAIAAGDKTTKTVASEGALAQDIPQDHKLPLSIEAHAGGLRKNYQALNGIKSELFKVGYIIELVEQAP